MKPKRQVFARIKQSYTILKNNIFSLILPIFLFHIVYFSIIWKIYFHQMIQNFSFLLTEEKTDFFSILYSSHGVYFIVIAIALFFIYLFLYIPFLLASIQSVGQAIKNQKVTIMKNIIWGGKNIIQSIATYWFIFVYVYLFPVIILIIGSIMFVTNYFFVPEGGINDIVNNVSIGILSLGVFLFIAFSIYRGLKATFGIYFAVSNTSFTLKNFLKSVKITKGNWWRIIGNFMLLGIILGFGQNIFGGILGMFLPSVINTENVNILEVLRSVFGNFIQGNFGLIIPNVINITGFDAYEEIEYVLSDYSLFYAIINSIVTQFINSLFILFSFTFTYLFMNRLEYENKKLGK